MAARPIEPTAPSPSEPAPERSRSSVLPKAIGPYRIEDALGAGGMGSVYAAVGTDGEPVALKVVRGSLTTEEALRRFEREASVRIDHPNVVRVIDAGTDDEGQPYIALERLHGETLAERLKERGALPVDEVFDVAIQAARGLEAAHAAGVVHRDLKPSNLFVCDDGTVKLLDFGVAALQTAETRLTQSGQVVGTLYYLSPEQAERSVRVDHRTDVWSLGALTFEALVGRPPFSEPTSVATVLAVMMAAPPRPSSLRPGVPRALEDVLLKALAKAPGDRWQTAAELRGALERARDAPRERLAPDGVARPSSVPPRAIHVVDEGVSADDATQLGTPIASAAEDGARGAKPRPPWAAALVAVVAVAIAIGGAAWWLASPAGERAATTESGHPASAAPEDGPAAATSSSGVPVAEPASDPGAGSPAAAHAPAQDPGSGSAAAAADGDPVADPSPADRAAEDAPVAESTPAEPSAADRPRRPRAASERASSPRTRGAPTNEPDREEPRPAARLRTSWDDPPTAAAPDDRPSVRGW